MAKKDIFRDPKLKLYGPPVSQGDKSPSMGISIYQTNVALNVYTNTERDSDTNMWIDARMSYGVLGQLFTIIRAFAGEGPLAGKLNTQSITVENYNTPKNDDGSSGMKQLVSLTEVGIDEKDELYIAVISADQARPMIRFKFYDTYWHVFKDTATGEPLSPQLMSRLGAISQLRMWESLIPDSVYDEFANGAAQTQGQSQGGTQAYQGQGNNQRQYSQGGGGFQKKQWNNNGGQYQKKPWNNNGGGGGWKGNNGGGNWQNKGNGGNWNNNNQGGQGNYQQQQGPGEPHDKVPF